VLVLALAACVLGLACGGRISVGRDGSAGAGSPVPMADGAVSNPALFDDRFDAYADYAPRCSALCSEGRPTPPTQCPYEASAEECTTSCARLLDNLDATCAECIFQKFCWRPPNYYCSSWECVCQAGESVFPNLKTDCEADCAASLAYQRRLREAVPRPAPVGRAPTHVL
jgi:hypothetical protein